MNAKKSDADWLNHLSPILSWLAMTVAILSILGWATGGTSLAGLLPGHATMKVNSAVAVLVLGYLLSRRAQLSGLRVNDWRNYLLVLPLFIGLSSGLEYLLQVDLGVDELLIDDPATAVGEGAPGRMSPITAILVLLTTIAVLLKRAHRQQRIALIASLFVLTLSLIGLYSYIFGVGAMYQFAPFATLSLNTVLAFLCLSVGLVVAPPRSSAVEAILGERGREQLSLRMLMAVFGLPVLVGLLALMGVQAGLYGQAFALAVLAATVSIFTATWLAMCFRLRDQIASDKQRVESELEQREDWFRVITENARELIMVADAADQVVFVSPSFAELFDAEPGTQLGRSLFDRWHPDDERDWSLLERDPEFQFRVRQKAGGWLRMSGSSRVVTIAGQVHRILIARDIEERLRFEERLRRQSRLEGIGRVAGGVAHDLNNYLTVIQGCVELVAGGPSADEETKELCKQALHVSHQATAMSRGLLTMGSGQYRADETIDPGQILKEMEPVLRHLMPTNVELSCDLKTEGLMIRSDPARFRQVLMNLVINARDAMVAGGQISIAMERRELDASAARKLAIAAGLYLVLSVTDTGCGISEAVQDRIFEPFFTTKNQAKGTGLGLASVYGFVRDAEGSIDLESELGRGSRFVIHWPCSIGPASKV